MKIILRIARTELATLFYSPIAWFILIVFSVITAKEYISSMDSIITWVDLEGGNYSGSLSSSIFLGSTFGFLVSIVNNLYVYIPLLTMGLISRETASGSIKLLYSSPVTSAQIVVGKYLAAIIFGATLLLIPLSGTIYSASVIPNFDWAPVLVGILGLYLLICAYCAIGLFVSSLTSYQVVAAVGTLVLLAALKFIGMVGQSYDFVRDVTHWLSINGRANDMLIGVIRSDDVIYFLAVVAMFVTFTVFKLSFARKTIGKMRQMSYYIGTLVVVLMFGYLTSRAQVVGVWDATRTKENSIAESSKEALSQLDGAVTITNYVNLLDNGSSRYLPFAMKNNESLFDAYCRFKPDLKVRYVYYYALTPDGIASNPKFQGKNAEELRDYLSMVYKLNPRRFKSQAEMDKIIDLSGEQYNFVRVIEKADGTRAYLRDFKDMQSVPSESEITAVFKKMNSVPPMVGFIKGHGEREITRSGDRDYGAFSIEKYSRAALVNQGFDVTEVELPLIDSIPSFVNILVLANPKQQFTPSESAKLEKYLASGGNMLILADVGTQDVVNPFCAQFGVKAESGVLAQPFADFYPDLVLSKATKQATILGDDFETIFTKRNLRVSMPECVALTSTDDSVSYTITPVLQTNSKGAWIEREAQNLKEQPVVFNPTLESEQAYTTAFAACRRVNGKEQRILIMGDADCMSNAELTIQREGYMSGNFELIIEAFGWLSNGEFPVKIKRDKPIDNQLSVGVDSIDTVKMIFIIIPVILVLTGVLLWIMRRKN